MLSNAERLAWCTLLTALNWQPTEGMREVREVGRPQAQEDNHGDNARGNDASRGIRLGA
jgi:hypothetical protein